jgi:flavin-dependent dehydrogenase
MANQTTTCVNYWLFVLFSRYDKNNAVCGVRTNDVGIDKNGKRKSSFAPGMDLKARLTIFGEGCRGHLTRELEFKHQLRAGRSHQTYGIGLKELWEVDPKKHQPGLIQHTVGWPVKSSVLEQRANVEKFYLFQSKQLRRIVCVSSAR